MGVALPQCFLEYIYTFFFVFIQGMPSERCDNPDYVPTIFHLEEKEPPEPNQTSLHKYFNLPKKENGRWTSQVFISVHPADTSKLSLYNTEFQRWEYRVYLYTYMPVYGSLSYGIRNGEWGMDGEREYWLGTDSLEKSVHYLHLIEWCWYKLYIDPLSVYIGQPHSPLSA